MLTPGERIILERLLELHPSDKAFDLFEMMRSEKPGEEIPTYYFSNPDPYFARESLPSSHEKRFDESGALHVQNFSANELPEITLTKEIGGTVYTVTGSYDGIELLDKRLKLASDEAIRVDKKKLAKAEKRLSELDRIFMRLYEDRVNGTISDERFSSMSKSYEDEQSQLKQEVETLAKEIAQQTRKSDDVERFIAQAHRYIGLNELTPYALHELVKAIYINAPDESSGKRRQSIHISYDFVGIIPIHELMQEEMA